MNIPESELVLNPDGSVYHLHLKPEDIASTIITVGDPERVAKVSAHFDSIRFKTNKREFVTHTGTYRGKELTVISTGIGTDNIDIVLTELDALVNIDLKTRKIKEEHTALDIVRIGTCGGLQEDVPLDSLVVSANAIGFDNFVYFYDHKGRFNTSLSQSFMEASKWSAPLSDPYCVAADNGLMDRFIKAGFQPGITVTNVGFYGPQGRSLRIPLAQPELNSAMKAFEFEGKRILNLEMETAGIYAMAELLGHRALSLNVILANRELETFSKDAGAAVDRLIDIALNELAR
ncbi:nucleoside phosphorylase [Gilvibacter sediminis]|uniref:nucleoside phosphorylase n=1 Tax=Gilvibacter sediminis TaxID=379071 RepID=UPI00234FE522|nr:nucleoside phosphorylase [Gilvibacter sediminis]MDC7998344.1 nucleoside phosphorylase [Gilvibacter sediminis]